MSTGFYIFLIVLLLFFAFAGLGFLASKTGQQAAEIKDLERQLAEALRYLEIEREAKEEALAKVARLESQLQVQPDRQGALQTSPALALGSLTGAVIGGLAVHKALGENKRLAPLRNPGAEEPKYTQSASPGSSDSKVMISMTRQQLDEYIKWQRGKS